jgi:guanylate kinase
LEYANLLVMNREEFLLQLPELVKNYQPAPEVVNQIKNVTLLIVIGPSGVGKTTIIKKSGLFFVPSDTTRPPRTEEEDAKDYYFLDDYQRLAGDISSGQFLQVAIGPTGDFYGTKASSYPASGVATMAIVADVVPIFRNLGFNSTVSIFITPPSYGEWVRRMSDRTANSNQLSGRLAEAIRSFSFALSDNQTHFILNEDIEMAVLQIEKLLIGMLQQERELTARRAATDILSQLK